jgi:hypothetical protein
MPLLLAQWSPGRQIGPSGEAQQSWPSLPQAAHSAIDRRI